MSQTPPVYMGGLPLDGRARALRVLRLTCQTELERGAPCFGGRTVSLDAAICERASQRLAAEEAAE